MRRSTLDGKVALVTGGTSGLGSAAVKVLSREGARVVIAARGAGDARDLAYEIEQAGGQATFLAVDVTSGTEVQELMREVATRYGRLDCAFNNAGTEEGNHSSAADFSEADFDRVVAVNFKSVWLCMKYEIQQMLQQRPSGGTIVNTSSISGLGGDAMGALYSAAKSGVLALTKAAAQDYGRLGIRINAIVPGRLQTPFLDRVLNRAARGDQRAVSALEAYWADRVPLGRIGKPEEAAEAAVWLLSDASSYVSGHSLIVDGGLTAPFR
jgi:NAD(P)-dependent dehydrogenase (short-subunit alcohol dehydrogenase family)